MKPMLRGCCRFSEILDTSRMGLPVEVRQGPAATASHKSGTLMAGLPAGTCWDVSAAIALHHVPTKDVAAIHADHQLGPSKGICAFVCYI